MVATARVVISLNDKVIVVNEESVMQIVRAVRCLCKSRTYCRMGKFQHGIICHPAW